VVHVSVLAAVFPAFFGGGFGGYSIPCAQRASAGGGRAQEDAARGRRGDD